MDAWGVDVMVAACQKGLMTPPGIAFTFHGPKAEATGVRCPSPYWDWGPRTAPSVPYERFCGTAPTHHLYGLRTALDMILAEEGLEAVWSRHAVFARAVWAAVEAWGAGGALALNIADPGRAATRSPPSAPPRATARACAAGAPTPPGLRSASASACRASIPTASSASATWATSTRRCCSARWRPSRRASAPSASAIGPGGAEAAGAVIADAGAKAARAGRRAGTRREIV